ncbi:hypothetical protein Hanom_Chr15g01376891 [Helianthus anomalus]
MLVSLLHFKNTFPSTTIFSAGSLSAWNKRKNNKNTSEPLSTSCKRGGTPRPALGKPKPSMSFA